MDILTFGWGSPISTKRPRPTRVCRTATLAVIFREVCLGTRSANGSENVAIFASIAETAKLRGCETLEIFEALLTGPPETAHEILFPKVARAG